ncbi:MAG TPA: ChbG/HpnK family deacetylase [Verrucomicrobiae bacterium]
MILCADDYGLSDDIDHAVLDLCGARKLSAVSCMVVFERCTTKSLCELRKYEVPVDIGLHFCLTDEGLPLATLRAGTLPWIFPSFGNLFRRALAGQVAAQEIASQVSTQYDLFFDKCGRRPDFIDGHLHVHQLPGVREGLLDFVLSLPSGARPYVRNTYLPLKKIRRNRLPWLKAALIGAFGAQTRKRLHAANVATNDGFAGIYDFREWQHYAKYLPRFAACLEKPNGILVVHPGSRDAWRRQELKTLREFSFASGSPNRFQH